jgi:hypothetical protein
LGRLIWDVLVYLYIRVSEGNRRGERKALEVMGEAVEGRRHGLTDTLHVIHAGFAFVSEVLEVGVGHEREHCQEQDTKTYRKARA